jgi:polysaccharide export outer membrane protein
MKPLFTVHLVLFLAIMTAVAGCGGSSVSKISRVIRIQSIDVESSGSSTDLILRADREFEPLVRSQDNPPSLDIRVPFAISLETGSLNRKLKLPRGGVNSIHVSRPRSKFGGVKIEVRMAGPFKHTLTKEKSQIRITLRMEALPARSAETPGKKYSMGKPKGSSKGKGPRFIIPETASLAGPERNYAIGGKDVISIAVFEEPDLTKDEIRVENDGFISFPLIGRIHVGGLSTKEIENLLVQRLKKDFLVNPQVTVQVKEFASKSISILGAVKRPGALSLKGRTTLLEMVARAGGVNIEEAGKNIIVLRAKPGKWNEFEHITIDLTRLLREGDLSLNLVLQDKDTIFIPRGDQIFVFGEVKKPGPYNLKEESV